MLLYEKLHWCLSTTYCRAVDVFLVLWDATNFYWGTRPIFCMDDLILHLKKGYSINYWWGGGGHVPLCPFSAYGSVLFHPGPRLIFQKKFR